MGSHFVIKKELMLNTYFYFTLSPEKFHEGLVLQTFLVWTPCFIKDFSEIDRLYKTLMIKSSSSPTCRHSTGKAGPGWQCRGETHCPCTGSFHSAGSACGTGLKIHIISSIISDKWHYLRHLLAVVGLRESRWAMTAPWPQPARVTDPGLPPKSATACCTQSRARATSVSPRLPGSSRVSSERKPSNPILNKFHRSLECKGNSKDKHIKQTCTPL